MSRTTAAAVKLVLAPGSDYDTVNNPDLTPFIDIASAVVDDVITCAADDEVTIGATRAELIERWLAAHYYKQSDQGYTSKRTADASGTFQGKTGMYLESTLYGQSALSLDTSGCLKAIASGHGQASAIWLGLPPSAQTDYVDRD